MIFKNIKIGTFFNVPVILHKTYFIFMIFIFVNDLINGGIPTALSTFGWITIVHFSIIVHEYGHIFAARKFGVECEKIYLTPIGGVACLGENFAYTSPKEELIIGAAGPATHLVWLTLLYGISFLFNIPIIIGLSNSLNILSVLVTLHIIIFLFNLIPAFPMDGGRIFRSIMCKFMSKYKATKILFFIGPIILLGVGIYFQSFFVFIITILAIFATQQELRHLRRGY